jgi:hypothetical protein
MGKSCIRFSKLEDVPLEVLAAAIRRMPSKRYIATYESQLLGEGKSREAASSVKSAAKKSAKK